MKRANSNNILLVFLFVLMLITVGLAPITATAQTQNTNGTLIGIPQGFNGIFSCNQNGAYALSVGALGATGGVYVPVADATVELNTGTLVYKECVLRVVVDAQRQAATAGILQQNVSQIQTGRNGSPQYVVNPRADKLSASNQVVVDDLQNNGSMNTLNSAYKANVVNTVARSYVRATQQPNSELACDYSGNLNSLVSGQDSGLSGIATLQNPACNQLGATMLANNLVMQDVADANAILDQEWLWSGGYYPITTGGLNPLKQQIVTPGSLVNSAFAQVVQSPFTQLQNANDIGQMVGALFAGVSTQLTSSISGGLNGLTQPIGNSPSYLQQAITQTTQNLQGAISNAALANLTAALQLEQGYYNIMSAISTSLIQATAQLRAAENQCWQQIVQHVCASPLSSSNTCPAIAGACTTDPNGNPTCPQGATLHVATSTAFSQAVINSNLSATGQIVAQNLSTSQQAITFIKGLIQSVSGTSPVSQANAIAQLNQLIANNQLHTQSQVNAAQQQQTSVQTSLGAPGAGGIVGNTIQLWAGTNPNDSTQTNIPWDGSTSPGVGWCNFQNQTTLQMWIQRWSS